MRGRDGRRRGEGGCSCGLLGAAGTEGLAAVTLATIGFALRHRPGFLLTGRLPANPWPVVRDVAGYDMLQEPRSREGLHAERPPYFRLELGDCCEFVPVRRWQEHALTDVFFDLLFWEESWGSQNLCS